MVMYKNTVGFSNVTGDMVLTECSVVTSYKRWFEGDTQKKNAFLKGAHLKSKVKSSYFRN